MNGENRRQMKIVVMVYVCFTLLFLASNVLMDIDMRDGVEGTLGSISGMLLGFVAFPIFCIALPLWLARRWNLEFSFWPRRKRWWLALAVVVIYAILGQHQTLAEVFSSGMPVGDFVVHFVSTTLFHISYYPLFAIFMLPVFRKNMSAGASVVLCAALFALFHFAGFYFFPAGLTLKLQVLLFISFVVNMLLYLWTESAILVALAHQVGGSANLAANGALFNEADELLIITAVIMVGLFAYMIVYEIRHRARPYAAGWWLQVKMLDKVT